MRAVAYCFASGHIGFGVRCPKGALPLVRGPARKVRNFIEPLARLAYDGKTLLVPGLPEAPNQTQALKSLHAFVDWIEPFAKSEGLTIGRRP